MNTGVNIEVIDLESSDDERSDMKPDISTIRAGSNHNEALPLPNQILSNQKGEIDGMLSTFMDLYSKLTNREQMMDPIQRLRWLNIVSAVKQNDTNEAYALSDNQEEDEEEEEEGEEETQTARAKGAERSDVYYKSPRQEPLWVEKLWTEPSTRRKAYKRKKKSYKRKSPKKAPRSIKAASTTAPSFQRAKQAATRMHNQIVKAKNHIKKTKPKAVIVKKELKPTIKSEK